MTTWKCAIAALGPAALLSVAGCLEPRERLDAPRVRMELEEDTVAAGAALRGVISAADLSGIVYVSASLIVDEDADSRKTDRLDFIDADTVDFAFFLPVVSDAPGGARIIVTATVIDNQLFTVTVEDTAHVR